MLSVGSNIRSVSEPLKKIPVEYLYNALRNPKPEISAKISRLGIVRQMSTEQYSKLKQQLPYFVCAQFNPPFRKTENFAYTEYFVIDIDHVGEKGLPIADLKAKIASDSRTRLCFLSPGQDGLKVLMRLSGRCYDAGVYSMFYKKFVCDYSARYGLEQVVDAKTSDVARACFMSVDPEAYYNPDSEPVDISSFIPADDSSALLSMKSEINDSLAELLGESNSSKDGQDRPKEPGDDAMARIRQMLDMKPKRQIVDKQVYVPEALNDIMDALTASVNETGMEIYEVINIQYGKKIRAKLGVKKAEVNLFYGHRGFTVVLSPKTGTDSTLNQLLADVVNSFLDS